MMFKVFEAKFSKRKFIESKNKNLKDSKNSITKNGKNIRIYDEEEEYNV